MGVLVDFKLFNFNACKHKKMANECMCVCVCVWGGDKKGWKEVLDWKGGGIFIITGNAYVVEFTKI